MILVTIFLRTIHRSALYLVSILIQRVVYWIICFISTHFEFNSRAKSRLRTVVFNFRLGFSAKGCVLGSLQIVRKFQFVREFQVVRNFQNQSFSGPPDRGLFWVWHILDTVSSFVDIGQVFLLVQLRDYPLKHIEMKQYLKWLVFIYFDDSSKKQFYFQ